METTSSLWVEDGCGGVEEGRGNENWLLSTLEEERERKNIVEEGAQGRWGFRPFFDELLRGALREASQNLPSNTLSCVRFEFVK